MPSYGLSIWAEKAADPVASGQRAPDLQAKLDDLRGKDQVIEVQVFPRHHDIVLTKNWETKMYTPPVPPDHIHPTKETPHERPA